MLGIELTTKLYLEKDQAKAEDVVCFIRGCDKPKGMLSDAGRAVYYYGKYMQNKDEDVIKVSKPYFLYIWLCMKEPKPNNLNMKHYYMFSNDDVKVEKLSYRYFTQIYVDQVLYTNKLNMHYSCHFKSVIRHRFPISLRSLFDKLSTTSNADRITLTENKLVTIKSMPNLMEEPDKVHHGIRTEKNNLVAEIADNLIVSNHRFTCIESSNGSQHSKYVNMISLSTDSLGRAESHMYRHIFAFPSREMNYSQIASWLISNNIQHSVNSSEKSAVSNNYISDSRFEVINRVLDGNKCYDNGDYEVYRLKGDIVLEIAVSSMHSKEYITQKILAMYNELDKTITEVFPDPMDLSAPDIAMLRATNSIAFDGMYCRKAPPRVQPIVVKQSQVEAELAKGKMILIYEGMYYTTKDRNLSNGADYIGMVNKFGNYDPNKPYNPIIRTYKKNHLLSGTFKELKAYLLRHSTDPNYGYVSMSDILLPNQMSYIYSKRIINPSADVSVIHTKKTVISNSVKVSTGEVPDYIKSALDTKDVRRIVNRYEGTGLLHCCGVTVEDISNLVNDLQARNELPNDLLSLTIDDINKDIASHNLDHRIYGKLIEDISGCSLIVFGSEGLVPYRYSKLGKDKYKLLFISSDNKYDVIAALPRSGHTLNLSYIKQMVNSSQTIYEGTVSRHVPRDIDYTLVMIKLVCYCSRVLESFNVNIRYKIVDESSCKELVEQVYDSCIYYECISSNMGALYVTGLVNNRKSVSNVVKSPAWLKHVMKDMLELHMDNVTILSPVDMSKYHLWNINLEDCLYNSVHCYKLSPKEEVQCIVK